MPRCVWSALSEIDELSQSAGSELWLHAAAARATNVVTYGEGVAAVARAVTAAGNAHKVVRCVDQSEARRVAQILALSGDIVVVGPGGYAIFPLSCGRPVRQGA